MTDCATYDMWAYDRGDWFQYFGDERYVKFHGLPHPAVKVRLVEDSDGEYFGWLPASEWLPRMIWRGWTCFSVQFPYGPEAEEKAGRGRIVRLRVERAEAPCE